MSFKIQNEKIYIPVAKKVAKKANHRRSKKNSQETLKDVY